MKSTSEFLSGLTENPIVGGVLILAAAGSLVGIGIAIGLTLQAQGDSQQGSVAAGPASELVVAEDKSGDANDSLTSLEEAPATVDASQEPDQAPVTVESTSTTQALPSTTAAPSSTTMTTTTTTATSEEVVQLTPLSAVPIVRESGTGSGEYVGFSPISLDLVEYADAWVCRDEEWPAGKTPEVEFRVDRLFKRLVGIAGYSDASPSGHKSELKIVDQDGRVLYRETFSLGQTAQIDIDISSALRLTFSCSDPEEESYIGIANPVLTS